MKHGHDGLFVIHGRMVRQRALGGAPVRADSEGIVTMSREEVERALKELDERMARFRDVYGTCETQQARKDVRNAGRRYGRKANRYQKFEAAKRQIVADSPEDYEEQVRLLAEKFQV